MGPNNLVHPQFEKPAHWTKAPVICDYYINQ
jgi:hypothetical protein